MFTEFDQVSRKQEVPKSPIQKSRRAPLTFLRNMALILFLAGSSPTSANASLKDTNSDEVSPNEPSLVLKSFCAVPEDSTDYRRPGVSIQYYHAGRNPRASLLLSVERVKPDVEPDVEPKIVYPKYDNFRRLGDNPAVIDAIAVGKIRDLDQTMLLKFEADYVFRIYEPVASLENGDFAQLAAGNTPLVERHFYLSKQC